MKLLVRAGLLIALIFMGLSYNQASADTNMTFATKCGNLPQNGTNPSPQQINCLLTNAALEEDIPPEVVKAVASQENGWKQFDANGQPYQSSDGGLGIMQITNQPSYDQDQLKNNISYNIEAGVEILNSMYNRTDLPKIKGAGREVIENWYFPVMAYNGTKPENSPLHQATGVKNTKAYQEKVFSYLEKYSFLGDTPLAQYPFNTKDFSYSTDSDQPIKFNKLEYTLTDQMHTSHYLFQTGDHVVVTTDANLRTAPTTTSPNPTKLAKNTPLVINGKFVFNTQTDSENQFVWYPVKTLTGTLKGYISSAYITIAAPKVNSVDDNDVTISGTAPANDRVQVMNGASLVVSGTADSNGDFKFKIAPQKAGTKLTVTYNNNLNATSLPATVIVADKTPPAAPIVNTVTNKAASVTGKTEANATVTIAVGGKNYSAKADRNGNYKVSIPIQNTGTSLSVTAKDSAGNKSAARKVTVVRVAPNMPTVNTVKYYSTAITGKTEKNDSVAVKIGSRTFSAKANALGNYKVSIPKQMVGTKLYVSAKDAKGKTSATRTVTVIK
jgi:hypothetical protein